MDKGASIRLWLFGCWLFRCHTWLTVAWYDLLVVVYKGHFEIYSRPPIISGTSVCPHAIQAILGRAGTSLTWAFFLFGGGTEFGLSAAGLRAAGFLTRLGLMPSPCVGLMDLIE